MSDNPPLRDRLQRDLTDNFSVSASATLAALIALFAFARIGDSATGGLLLALAIAVFVPYAYEQFWPEEYAGAAAAVWTISAALVTTGLFVGIYQLSLDAGAYAPGIAFVVTVTIQYVVAALFMRARQNA
ncbi:hypothetical protein [Natronoarchaeum rubrum]|uniref:hypothetical protein n=1 Tax=Natronoarchaeum rubrum TaxID=755311 RepID=UPI002111BEC5|nr:hypothetical protein [Natronoarchaeum rubrum]